MTENIDPPFSQNARQILEEHVNLGPQKPVSYLPLRTVEKVIGLTASEYSSLITKNNNECIVFSAEECCINSGAIYAYDEASLREILNKNEVILVKYGCLTEPRDFIKKIATEWFDLGDPIMPVIRLAFGDK